MVVGNKRYCDECNFDDAQRYYVGWVVRDYCFECAIKNNVIILYDCSKYIKYVENKYGKDMRNKCKKK